MQPRPAPTISGDLGRTSVAALFWSLRQRALSGTLAVHGECHAGAPAGETLLTFERGSLTQLRQAQPLDTLGCLLREQGAITREHFDESLARLAAREGLQGEILVAMGACGPEAVVRALRAQLRRKALRLFALEEGRFEFYRGCDLLADFGRERHPEDVLTLLWPGVRAYPEHRAVAAAAAQFGLQAVRLRAGAETGTEVGTFGFERAERAAIELLRAGPATPEALVGAGCSLPGARALVALLLTTGMAELTTDSDGPRRTTSGIQPILPGVGQERPLEPPRRVSTSNLPAVREVECRVEVIPPGPVMGPAVKPATTGLRVRLAEAEARYAAMQNETYFQMLGVDPDASPQELRAGYLDQATRWHPDAAPEGAIALREVGQQILKLLDEAGAALGDEAARRRHLAAAVAGAGTPNARRGMTAVADAKTRLHTAEVCLRCGAFDEAAKTAREALVAMPDLPGAIVVLVTVLLQKNQPASAVEALAWVTRGLKVAPDNDQLNVLAGRVHESRGDARRALDHFVRAYKINPKNMDAVRELRAAAARQRNGGAAPTGTEGGPAGNGLFAKLFGR